MPRAASSGARGIFFRFLSRAEGEGNYEKTSRGLQNWPEGHCFGAIQYFNARPERYERVKFIAGFIK